MTGASGSNAQVSASDSSLMSDDVRAKVSEDLGTRRRSLVIEEEEFDLLSVESLGESVERVERELGSDIACTA